MSKKFGINKASSGIRNYIFFFSILLIWFANFTIVIKINHFFFCDLITFRLFDGAGENEIILILAYEIIEEWKRISRNMKKKVVDTNERNVYHTSLIKELMYHTRLCYFFSCRTVKKRMPLVERTEIVDLAITIIFIFFSFWIIPQ